MRASLKISETREGSRWDIKTYQGGKETSHRLWGEDQIITSGRGMGKWSTTKDIRNDIGRTSTMFNFKIELCHRETPARKFGLLGGRYS